MTEGSTVIGIDLGTTYSCVGICTGIDDSGKYQVDIIANNYRNRTTPSCVSFSKDEILIGKEAIDYSSIEPENTVFDVKRIIGRNFNDKMLQSDIKRWPFKVIEKNNGKPYIRVNYNDETKDYSPEEISSLILKEMQRIAKDYIGNEINDAVITVPAYFNNAQRKATKKAGEMAGLNVLRIVNEPTAAAIAYGFDILKSKENTNILVIDIGGGTLDVSLLTIKDKNFEVKATSGDTHLGGEDFDNRLVDHFVNEFKNKYEKDLTTNSNAMRRLEAKCEQMKCKLSTSEKAKLSIDYLYDDINFISNITRILVGGSSRIPKIQSLISEYFDGKKLYKNINPDEAVAQGATIISGFLSGMKSDKIKDIKIQERAPFSLGIDTLGEIMNVFIKQNTPIPIEITKNLTTIKDNQTRMRFKIYEGERSIVKGNNFLGEFTLTEIPPKPRGKSNIKATIKIDENGILNVSAIDSSTGKYSAIKIDYDEKRLPQEEKEQIINDAEKYKEEDEIEVKRIESRYDLEWYASDLQNSLNDPNKKSKIEINDYNKLMKKVKSTIKWIDTHQNESQIEYEKIKLELKNMVDSIMSIDDSGKYQVDIIANNYGNSTTPSYVSFIKDEIFIGEEALDYSSIEPENTVFDVKRIIGRNFNDEMLQSDIKRWPFKVIEKNNGKPYIRVNYKNEIKDFSPEEISSMILKEMKRTAEDYIGNEINNAVITVPAYFNNAQRKATKEAGEMAGLNVLRIVNEPTAAAIAYGFDKLKSKDNTNILVIDIGGGTLDVSLLTIKDKNFEVKATSGDTHLGGEDFDNRLVDHFVNEFKNKYEKDLTTNSRAMRRLKANCKRMKRILSKSEMAELSIEYLYDDINFVSYITRSKFEELNKDLFKKIIIFIENVINDSGISKSNIEEIILVGGSSRIPKIQSLISEYFDGKKLYKNINPDEAVAQGATIISGFLSGMKSDKINDIKLQDIKLKDIVPFSLGISRLGITNVFIKRNTPIPIEITKNLTTTEDNQTCICFKIYEGERSIVKGNNYLGEFTLTEIPSEPRGKPKIKVTIKVDENGILNVSAIDSSTGKYSTIKINYNEKRLPQKEKEWIISDAEKYKEEDEIEVKRIESRYDLEWYASDLQNSLNDQNKKSKIEINDYNKLMEKVKSTIKWIKTHKNESQIEYEKIKLELKNMAYPIMTIIIIVIMIIIITLIVNLYSSFYLLNYLNNNYNYN
ncbi:heat shock protein 70 [Neocallimastix californiae]|uniref:Heat shock protein 70 n=1 Tax=Neocallimastix californiae TaxID=1754190 RepID=A0A1Y2ALI1_9FUNG|nr:heat shock protein 70 [Neocallimastix californiae]|eukprot:ORY23150.1 heat shock protein 70 [Neocallimastix californiae]